MELVSLCATFMQTGHDSIVPISLSTKPIAHCSLVRAGFKTMFFPRKFFS